MSHRKSAAGGRSSVLAALLTTTIFASAAAAQERTLAFDLPPKPLADALRDYGKAADRQLIFSPDLVRTRQAPAVRGHYTPDAALDLLLSGSDLAWRRAPAGGIMIVRREAARPQSDGAAPATEAMEVAQVVVTGTRIAGVAPVGSRPVVLDRRDIEASGRATAADLLRLLPQATGLGVGEEARRGTQTGPSNISFATVANLRGLGGDATLTLVDGHRVASSNQGGLVDIGQIPLLAVQRVEVLTDGASALYGSDAVAGVVNFVLRSNYDGAESVVRYGASDAHHQITVSQVIGRTWSTGSVMAAVEYFDQSNLRASERSFYTDDLRAFGGPNLRTANGVPGTITSAGITYAIPPGQNGIGLTAAQLVAGTANRRNRWADADVLPNTTKWSGALTVNQQLTSWAELYGDALLARRDSTRADLATQTTLTVPRTNPFFVNPNPAAQTTTVLYNFAGDIGAGRDEVFSEDLTFHGGVRFKLPYAWRASISGLAGRNRTEEGIHNSVNLSRVAAALADPNPATAFNPFGDRGSNSTAVLDRIRGDFLNVRQFSVRGLSADANGDLFTLPGGAVRLAVGAETRRERLHAYSPSTLGATPVVVGVLHLSRRIQAAYGELYVPLVGPDNTLPFAEALTLSAALRTESYSDVGDTTNPKIGFEWRPFAGLTVSGTWGASFKAPLLAQTVPTRSVFVQALGLQNGPANVIVVSGNNPGLRPEKADTWTAGFLFEPAAAPGLRIELNYFSIDYKDRLLRPAAGEFVAAIAGGCNSPITIACNPPAAQVQALYADPNFTGSSRPPANTIAAIIDNRFSNLGRVEESGLDGRITYVTETHYGELQFDLSATHIDRYKVIRIQGGPVQDLLDTISNPISDRARATAAWRSGPFSAAVSANYVDGYRNTTITPNQRVSSWTTFDTQLAYHVTAWGPWLSNITARLDVRNAFDRKPPHIAQVTAAYGYDPEQADAIGRFVSLTLTKTW